jgi:methionyl-tRNA formyltransferase
MRVVAVTQSDPFFTGRFFASFLEEIQGRPVELVEIVVLPNFRESRSMLARRLLRLYGPVDFARLACRYAAARARDGGAAPATVEALGRSRGVRVRRLDSINDPEFPAGLRQQDVDVLLSVAAPEIFRREALAAAPLVLNVHSGKLPDYRGMMPTFWALLNGDRHVVVTLHEMDERVDAGAVLAEYPLAIEPGESAFDLAARAKALAGREVARYLDRVAAGAQPRESRTPTGRGRYYRFPQRSDVRALRAAGRRML